MQAFKSKCSGRNETIDPNAKFDMVIEALFGVMMHAMQNQTEM